MDWDKLFSSEGTGGNNSGGGGGGGIWDLITGNVIFTDFVAPALGGPDPKEFWKQLQQEKTPWNLAYERFCQEFAPDLIRTGDIWNGPFSRPNFLAGVEAWNTKDGKDAIPWAVLIGKINRDFTLKPGNDPVKLANSGSSANSQSNFPPTDIMQVVIAAGVIVAVVYLGPKLLRLAKG